MIDLSTHKFVSLDIEGDGNSNSEPVEIGIVSIVDLQPVDTLTWLINPGRRINPYATKVHGLRNQDVADCPTFDVYADTIAGELEGAIVLGHAIDNDLAVIRRKLPDVKIAGHINTLKLARFVLERHKGVGLHHLATELDLPLPNASAFPRGAHSAPYDATLTLTLFHRLCDGARAERWLKSAGFSLPRAVPLPHI